MRKHIRFFGFKWSPELNKMYKNVIGTKPARTMLPRGAIKRIDAKMRDLEKRLHSYQERAQGARERIRDSRETLSMMGGTNPKYRKNVQDHIKKDQEWMRGIPKYKLDEIKGEQDELLSLRKIFNNWVKGNR